MRRRMILIGLAAAALAGPSHAGSTADAEAAFENEDYERAFALYSRAIQEAGADPIARASALFDRAEIYSRLGKTPEALADYGAALALSRDPSFKALTAFGRGDLYAQAEHRQGLEAGIVRQGQGLAIVGQGLGRLAQAAIDLGAVEQGRRGSRLRKRGLRPRLRPLFQGHPGGWR